MKLPFTDVIRVEVFGRAPVHDLSLADLPPTASSDERARASDRISRPILSWLQLPIVVGAERPAPLPNGFVRHGDSSFGKQIFDISEAHAESVVEPDGMTNDLGRESMSAVAVFHLVSLTPAVLT